LFLRSDQVAAAIDKYLFVADTFAARDEMDSATGLYEQVLRLAPMNLDVRHKLIALLLEHHLVEQALEQKLALAEAFFELAQVEAAQEQYREALDLASHMPHNTEWTARILRRLGDINFQRLDWHGAIQVFLQLKAAVPEDPGVRRRLVELCFNLARRSEAITELDGLIDLYRRQGNLSKGLQMLDELIEARPEELELYKNAAQLCVEIGHKEGAITYLDAMGELQLQMGRVREASATIKAIIALRPKDIDAYRELLDQIA
jgi:tetratricopeptide (TPR) repeat protein